MNSRGRHPAEEGPVSQTALQRPEGCVPGRSLAHKNAGSDRGLRGLLGLRDDLGSLQPVLVAEPARAVEAHSAETREQDDIDLVRELLEQEQPQETDDTVEVFDLTATTESVEIEGEIFAPVQIHAPVLTAAAPGKRTKRELEPWTVLRASGG